MLGKLTLEAIPYHNPIIMGAGAFMGLVVILVLGSLFYFNKWSWLWREWLTSVDHKKIGIMYFILAVVMFLRGGSDAVMMRLQQALAVSPSLGYLPPEHYDQVFTAHGVIMIFFAAMPFVFAGANLFVPLQIGARDVAFPFLNSLSLWLTVVSALLVNVSLVVGKFAATGWVAYAPLSELTYSPGVGVDYYIWAIQISGVGSLLSAINFTVTIFKMRCPGMTLMRMPLFVWTVLSSMLLIMIAFPVLAVTLALLFFDRALDMHFFTSGFGGWSMMYTHLFWFFGHPEVYILVLPAFGMLSMLVAMFSSKPIFGYTAMVWATVAITVLSFLVWLHHFYTMGAGPNVNSFFGIMTMIIGVPTGVKVFNWIFTMYRGRVTLSSAMYWLVGGITLFLIGGATGVLLAIPGVDFQVHNSLFVIAHFHYVIIPVIVFPIFAAFTVYFPKFTGFLLNERLGKYAFWCWFFGFFFAFTPLFVLGLKGMTRRLNHYDASTGWHPYLVVAALGTALIAVGLVLQVLQVLVSIKDREKNRDKTGDPWDGHDLEWTLSSPPPFYNFAILPKVGSRDAFWEDKRAGKKRTPPKREDYEDIHMPCNTSCGFIIGVVGFIFGFSMVWHIYWLSVLALVAIFVTVVARSFDENTDYYLKAEEVYALEMKRWGAAT